MLRWFILKSSLAVSTVLALLLTAVSARADITVTGTGKVTVVPDIAMITLAVVTDGSSGDEALQANNESMRKLFDLLARLGIEQRDVQTTHFALNPKYHQPRDGTPGLIGYTATNQISVRVRKLAETGKVLDSLVKEGANRVSDVTFAVADAEKALGEARARAIAQARQKAEQYAAAGDVVVGPIKSISEGQSPGPMFWRMQAPALKEGVPLAPGEQELTVTVTVVFGIGKAAG